MDCAQCVGIEEEFNDTEAARDLARYHKRGPDGTTRILLKALRREGVVDRTLLDIGGGVGALQHELLGAGAARATSVDASDAYLRTAREEAERRGHADRLEQVHGDFVAVASEIPPADIVTLDRVLCCYDDMGALVRLSAARASHFYGLVFPRERWWMRLFTSVANLYYRLRRSPFRVFLHATAAVDALIREAGLRPHFRQETLAWQVVVYRRV